MLTKYTPTGFSFLTHATIGEEEDVELYVDYTPEKEDGEWARIQIVDVIRTDKDERIEPAGVLAEELEAQAWSHLEKRGI